MKFLPVVLMNLRYSNSKYFNKIWQLIKYFLLVVI